MLRRFSSTLTILKFPTTSNQRSLPCPNSEEDLGRKKSSFQGESGWKRSIKRKVLNIFSNKGDFQSRSFGPKKRKSEVPRKGVPSVINAPTFLLDVSGNRRHKRPPVLWVRKTYFFGRFFSWESRDRMIFVVLKKIGGTFRILGL